MGIVKYARYRQYERQRTEANNSMMGLLAGSQLASHTLYLTQGSHRLLSEIFPNVPHIRRFNLKTESAKKILDEADAHLGAMAIPYALAIHEDFLFSVLEMLRAVGLVSSSKIRALNSSTMHEHLESLGSRKFSAESLELFHLARLARNAQIHSGGTADSSLANWVGQLSPNSLQVWRTITKRAVPQYRPGDLVALGLQDLIGVLAVTKRLAEETNELTQVLYPRSNWADLVVEEWHAERKPGNPAQQLRKVAGMARRHYEPLNLTKAELGAAMQRNPV